MATKNNHSKAYDYYAKADPDEPLFVLLGRDKHAPLLVRTWARLREADGEVGDKISDALQCSMEMEAWLEKIGKTPIRFRDEVIEEMVDQVYPAEKFRI